MRRNWDVLLVGIIATTVFLYNLDGWMIMTLEEWNFYTWFTTDWHVPLMTSTLIPSFVLLYPLPTRDFMLLRTATALLSVIGVVLFYVALRQAASRKAGFIGAALVLTDTWFLWYGRHFFWIWSGLTLGALAIFLFVWRKEHSLLPTAVVNGINVLNFGQAIFFTIPFLSSQLAQFRQQVSRRLLLSAVLVFLVIISPGIYLFLNEQPYNLSAKSSSLTELNVLTADTSYIGDALTERGGISEQTARPPLFLQRITLPLPVLGAKTITWVVDPVNAFYQMRNRFGYRPGNLYNFDFMRTHSTVFNVYAALLLLYPLYFLKTSTWDYRLFFGGGAALTVPFLIIFPFLVHGHYFWGFALFLYPCLAYGAAEEDELPLKLTALLLILLLLGFQGASAYEHVLTRDYRSEYTTDLEQVFNEQNLSHIVVTDRAYDMITHSDLPIPGNVSFTIQGYQGLCSPRSSLPKEAVLSSDGCKLQRDVIGGARWLQLYAPANNAGP